MFTNTDLYLLRFRFCDRIFLCDRNIEINFGNGIQRRNLETLK